MSDNEKKTWDIETPRGPTTSDGIPDRSQEDGLKPPILNPGDHKNPNDPPLPLVSPIVDGGNL
ncbi:hypothetical protein [Pararhizobium sp.]|uniref:hypothetical protein n=1 Tax=Pararhizobium sp. TaxID=1977563 RepID=UPI00271B3393|nr:hypothetical protein [Pararhizobium sp.]MDO9415995.1 hypothetical protein [Pararhizobium sp.]